ncbi:hypothetical protein KFZ76_21835 [Methylovulum psychrotolerans]|uniref:DUF4870 family protein n=1 Tax=Methylovulum psychrotolerans TaxID=1704499 RepID=UPI001BFFB6BC|nr:hypothetical protein [Methylovulum psychrotolerans]MBT9100340.1 hypothetical protein [Methylovulum psychrotolerans]
MSDLVVAENDISNEKLKNLTVTVYICQILTFALAGLPLLIGVAINFYNRNEVQGTWLESHFNWQIKTVWITLAGFALAGLVLTINMEMALFILIPTLVLLVYRIVIGWTTLAANQPIKI